MSQLSFNFGDYDGSKKGRHVKPFEQKFPIAASKLKASFSIPELTEFIKKRVSELGEPRHFIQHKITTTTEGIKFLRNFELWNVTAIVKTFAKNDPQKQEAMKIRLDEDCIGLTERPNEDSLCYEAIAGVGVAQTPGATTTGTAAPSIGPSSLRSAAATATGTDAAAAATTPAGQTIVNRTQYRPTEFLNLLKHFQNEIYVRMRISIGDHLDSTAKAELQNYVDREQDKIIATDNGLTDANFFDKDRRVKWSKIKEYIITLCKLPLESERFIKFRTVKRKDSSTLTIWANEVSDIKKDVDSMGAHWKVITEREAMATTARWMTDVEKNLFDQLMISEGMKGTYPTFDDIPEKMKLSDFQQLCAKLDPKKVPKNFKQDRSKKAMKATYILYSKAERMVAEKTKALTDRVSQVVKQLQDEKNKVTHLNKTVRINNEKLKKLGRAGSLQGTITPMPAPAQPHGVKTHPKYCQLCWNKGLFRRIHTEKQCDPAQQIKALAKQAALKAENSNNKSTKDIPNKSRETGNKNKKNKGDKTRKYAKDQYKKWACEHCVREDVQPAASYHNPATCFRRPGGPLDEENITDPKQRTKRSREMATEKAKAHKKKAGSTKRVAFTSQSEAVSPGDGKTKRSSLKNRNVHDKDQPENKYTEQELRDFTWSAPSRHWNRYLLSKEYAKNPLTNEELDLLIPEDLADSPVASEWVCQQLGEVHNKRRLYQFRKNPKEYARRFKRTYSFFFEGQRERENAQTSRRQSKRKAKVMSDGEEQTAVTVTRPTKKKNKRANDRRRNKRTREQTKDTVPEDVQHTVTFAGQSPRYADLLPGASTGLTDEEPDEYYEGDAEGDLKRREISNARRKTRKRFNKDWEQARRNTAPPPVTVEYGHKNNILNVPTRIVDANAKVNESGNESSDSRTKEEASANTMDGNASDDGAGSSESPCYQPTPTYETDDEESNKAESGDDNVSDNPDNTASDSYSVSEEVTTSNCIRVTRSNVHITPAEVATHVATPKIKIDKIRWGAVRDRLEDMKSIPLGLWCPATRKPKPLGITFVNKQRNTDHINPKSKLQSEEKHTRLLQAYMKIKTPDGKIIKGRVQLDTMSNVNYVLAKHALPRAIRPWESTHAVGISNQLIKLGVPNQLTVMKHGKPIAIDTVRAKPHMFRHGCIALLGADAIHTLGIDLNYHIDQTEHVDVRYREESLSNEVCIRAEEQALERYPTFQQLERQLMRKTYLSERVCADYLKKNPDEYKEEPIPLESIDICPNVPQEIKAMIIALLRKYESVFSKKTNELPKPLKHVGAHKFKLKPGATPTRVGRPKFGPSQAKIINDWLDWALNCTTVIDGKVVHTPLVEPATTTSWSSRLVLAPKYKSTSAKSNVPDGIRVTWAGTGANEMIQKTVPTYPDAWQQLYKVANYKYKFSADGLKQYWSIPLDEESREVTAFWTPRGLYKFTRLVMGTKNAATVAQNAYTRALNTFLHEGSQQNIANFADDFIGGDDTYEGLVHHFEQFLKMCQDTNITLNPAKVRIGYIREQWYGLMVEEGRISPADRNLDPVKRMVAPKNKSELRSVLGIFDQFGKFIPNYMVEGSPANILHSLMPKEVDFTWTSRHEQAMQALKKIVLEDDICLFAPDHNHKLILETDASNDGWGAVLYQKIDGEKRIIKMWSKAWKTEAWKKKPTYHREAKAWMNGLTLTIPYALCNKYPVECWTDHTPLTWIKHTSGKGPVSQFIIDQLSIIDYEMHYIKGKNNDPADTLSRFPLIGPRTLQQSGTRNALNIMLAALVGTHVDPSRLWIYVGKDTKYMTDDIQEWRHNMNKIAQRSPKAREQCYMDLFSTSNIRRLKYTLGIWAPDSDKVTQQCYGAFKKGIPFACLVPNDLVEHIARDSQGKPDAEVARQVEAAFKITLLSPGLTWIIHGVDFSKSQPPVKTVHQLERVTPDFDLVQLCKTLSESSMTPAIPRARTRADWIKEQKKFNIAPLWSGTEGVFQAQDGLLVFQEEEGAPLKTIVPPSLQIPLVERKHKAMCHVGSQKVFTALKRSFHWKNMRRTCRHVNDQCALCNLLKARMKHAHKHFRPKIFCTPRTAYGADYYGVNKNKEGYNNILGIIDLATGNLILEAVKQRTAANTAHTLFYKVINAKGVPLLFHSDAAREFVSTAMDSLTKTLGIVQTNTLAHNPKSNAKIERVWQFVGRCLRNMNKEQYAEFHKYVPVMAHVWNTVPDSDTGITPFQAEHGMACRSIAESILQHPPAQGLPATAADLKSIAVSVSAFMEHINNVKAVEKAQAAIRLNANGSSRIHYQVGDQVAFYLPPDDRTVRAMGKKKKHMLQYVGPGEIVEVLSPNNTAFRIKYENRHYERNVMHLSKYKSPDRVPGDIQVALDPEVTVGSFIALLDDTDDNRYHIAKVIDITDDNTTVHYHGTMSRQLRGAAWKPLFHHPGTNEVTLHTPANLARGWTMFTGVIETRSLDDSLIILANLGLTDTMRLNATTRKLLNRTKYKHHIKGRSW